MLILLKPNLNLICVGTFKTNQMSIIIIHWTIQNVFTSLIWIFLVKLLHVLVFLQTEAGVLCNLSTIKQRTYSFLKLTLDRRVISAF